jgi:hypothetical protein
MVRTLTQPPEELDFKNIIGAKDAPEGVYFFAKYALALTAQQVDELRVLAQQVRHFQELDRITLPAAELERDFPQLYLHLEVESRKRDIDIHQFLTQFGSSTFGASEVLSVILIELEIRCAASLWVVARRELIQATLAALREARILVPMQDSQAHRVVDDLNRTLYRTLTELRKQQDWRLHTSV